MASLNVNDTEATLTNNNNVIIVNQRKLTDVAENRRKELAQLIVTNDNWRKIGLEFTGFTISEAYLKTKYGEQLASLRLCEHLLEELASRNVSIQSFISVLNKTNIGMGGLITEISNIILDSSLYCYFIICSTTVSDEEYKQLVQAIIDMDDTKEMKSFTQWDIINKMIHYKKEQLININAFQQSANLIILTKLNSKPFRGISRIAKQLHPPNLIIVDNHQDNKDWSFPKLIRIGKEDYKPVDIPDVYIANWKQEECEDEHNINKIEAAHVAINNDVSKILCRAPKLDFMAFLGGNFSKSPVSCFLPFWLDTHDNKDISTDCIFPLMIKVEEDNAKPSKEISERLCFGSLSGCTMFFFLTTVSSYWSMLFDHEQFLKHFDGLTVLNVEPLTKGDIEDLMKIADEENKAKLSYLKLFCDKIEDSNVDQLDLSNKVHPELPKSILQFTNLTKLDISCNRLISLPTWISQLTTLNKLDLDDNQLSTLPSSISTLTNLKVLYLISNRLSTLPSSISTLTNLTALDLSANQLSTLPESISALTNLNKLFLRNNQLSTLPESMSTLAKLKELHLGYNKLSALPSSISTLTKLNNLDLIFNKLSTLPDSISTLTNLNVLYLNHNKLSRLDELISTLTSLNVLYLNQNKLSTLPSSISTLTSLNELYLHDNQLSTLPDSISALTNLNELYLNYNQLSTLPSSISTLTNLNTLNLNSNKLSTLPESILILTNLNTLYLIGNNQLSTLPESISALINLPSFTLIHGNIQIMSSITMLTSLNSLDISSNLELKPSSDKVDNHSDLAQTSKIQPLKNKRRRRLANTNIVVGMERVENEMVKIIDEIKQSTVEKCKWEDVEELDALIFRPLKKRLIEHIPPLISESYFIPTTNEDRPSEQEMLLSQRGSLHIPQLQSDQYNLSLNNPMYHQKNNENQTLQSFFMAAGSDAMEVDHFSTVTPISVEGLIQKLQNEPGTQFELLQQVAPLLSSITTTDTKRIVSLLGKGNSPAIQAQTLILLLPKITDPQNLIQNLLADKEFY